MSERQLYPKLDMYRKDHVARYKYARNYIRTRERKLHLRRMNYAKNNVLDFGCGSGYGAVVLDGCLYTGIDNCRDTISFANEHFWWHGHFHVCDVLCASRFEIAKGFRYIIAFEFLEHLNSTDVNTFRRVLQELHKNAVVFLSVPNEDDMPFNANRFPHHHRHYTSSELEKFINSCGLKILSTWGQIDHLSSVTPRGSKDRTIGVTAQKK